MTERDRRSGRPCVRSAAGRDVDQTAVTGPPHGQTARSFALVQEADDDDGTPVREVAAYGTALPDGRVATLGPSGMSIYFWQSPESASRRLDSEPVRLV